MKSQSLPQFQLSFSSYSCCCNKTPCWKERKGRRVSSDISLHSVRHGREGKAARNLRACSITPTNGKERSMLVRQSLSHFYTIPTQGLVPPLVGRHSHLSQHNQDTPPNWPTQKGAWLGWLTVVSRRLWPVNQQSHNPPQGTDPHQHLLTYSIPRTLSEAFSCILDQVSQNHTAQVYEGLRPEGRKQCRAKWVFAGIRFRLPLWGTLGTDGSRVNPHWGKKISVGCGLRDALGGGDVSPFHGVWCELFAAYRASRGARCSGLVMGTEGRQQEVGLLD